MPENQKEITIHDFKVALLGEMDVCGWDFVHGQHDQHEGNACDFTINLSCNPNAQKDYANELIKIVKSILSDVRQTDIQDKCVFDEESDRLNAFISVRFISTKLIGIRSNHV